MKAFTFRMLCILTFSLCLHTVWAQVPQKFNYQGIARDAKGNPLSQQHLSLKLTVLPTADALQGEYEEVQTVTTNEFGLYTLQIGNGVALTGDMKSVKWETGNKYIRVAIDPQGGNQYVEAGTTQLLSVPYAIYADKAGSAKTSGGDRTGTVTSNAAHVAGDANYITKFTALNVIGKSRLFDNGTSIGLGTTMPVSTAAMHIRRTTSGQYLYMENPDTIGFGSFRLYNDVPTNFATFTKYGSKTTGGYTGISALYPFANMLGYGNNGPFLNAGTGNIGFAITKAGTNKLKIHIDAASERVGFGGNAVPQSQIHFNNTAAGNDTVKFTNQSTGHTSTDGTEFQFAGNTTRLMNRENASLILGTNNADRFAISATGNVGVGTLTPTATLDVNGQIRVQGGAPGVGKVLTSDATGLASWQTPAAGGGSGPWTVNGIHIHNNNTGNVGVGTTTPTARFQVADSSVVFSAGGDTSISSPNAPPPIQGAGRRMMWFPQRGAFRAGGVGLTDATNWDRDSIGLYSMALGWNTKATERATFAAGERAQANGFASISLGDDTRANGIRSVAMGDGTQANGTSSLATGEFTQANGPFSTAMGANSQANANFSMATGLATLANGVSSTAMGSVTQANGNASTSMGELTQANGMYSTSMGNNTQANGYSSLVVGQYNDTLVGVQNAVSANTPLFTVGNGSGAGSRSNAMVVLNNGNVGVGNINPSAKLEVDGQVKINGGAPGNGKVLVSDAVGLATWQTPPLGPAGADGKSVLNGAVNPTAGVGNNGDFYINTASNQIFGPKTAGVWGSGTSLIGPAGAAGPAGPQGIQGLTGPAGAAGATGATGPQGPAGANGPTGATGAAGPQGPAGPAGAAGLNGNTILNGASNPTGADGVDGDFYLNVATNEIFGPKFSGAWGSGTSLLGPAGPAGPQGPTGLLPAASAAGNTPYWDGFNWEVNSANIFNNGNFVGIGSALPTTKLDLNGDLALRTFNITLVNGSNAIITPAQQYSSYRITGPTAAFSIYGIANAQEGRVVTLYNATNFPMTLQNMVPLAGANALRTGTADVTIGAYGSATLQFNTTENVWALMSTSGAATGGTPWLTTGNAAAGLLSLGTTTNQPFQFIANNIARGRVNPADGEFVWGATASPYAGDGLSAVATPSLTFALSGYSAQNGSGTWGEILSGSTTAFSAVQGVYGGSGAGAGVLGNYNGTGTSNTRSGVYGVCSTPAANAGGAGVYGYNAIASGAQRMGVLGSYNGAAFGIGVHGIAFGGGIMTGNNDVAVVGWRANNANYSGYFNGNHVIANGTKSASVATSKGNQLLYVTETPGVFFEDIGRAQLVNGQAVVQLDPLFLETIFVDSAHPMHVFVQMEGESEDVYVVPGTTGFTVKEKKQGTSNAAFSYRIMAKRMNFQDHRFGNDPVWGEGDTRQYAQYAPPPPVNYEENVKFQNEQRKNWKPTPMPKGFRYLQDEQRESGPATERASDKR